MCLFKKGTRDKLGNHRQVSITSVVEKVLEETLIDMIYLCLARQRLIKYSKHDFAHEKSCLTNLTEVFDEVTNKIDQDRAEDIET